MPRLDAFYPWKDDVRFDFDYYAGPHTAMFLDRIAEAGPMDATIERGVSGLGPGSDPAYACVFRVHVKDVDALRSAFDAHGEEILGDIPNFTNVEPVIQISEDV